MEESPVSTEIAMLRAQVAELKMENEKLTIDNSELRARMNRAAAKIPLINKEIENVVRFFKDAKL